MEDIKVSEGGGGGKLGDTRLDLPCWEACNIGLFVKFETG